MLWGWSVEISGKARCSWSEQAFKEEHRAVPEDRCHRRWSPPPPTPQPQPIGEKASAENFLIIKNQLKRMARRPFLGALLLRVPRHH